MSTQEKERLHARIAQLTEDYRQLNEAWHDAETLNAELLEALNELYRLRGLDCDLQDEASLRAAAAIAKAEGRSE